MLSAVGADLYGEKIAATCTACGLDFSRVRTVPGASTSTYVYLGGPDGDMALAVSDMEVCNEISPSYLEKNLTLLNGAQLVVVDANIPQESIEFLAEHVTPRFLPIPSP